MSWGAATDSSGISTYYAGWTESPIATLATLNPLTSEAREFVATVADPAVLYAHLIAVDGVGNEAVVTAGPFYIDGTTTPDLITAGYGRSCPITCRPAGTANS